MNIIYEHFQDNNSLWKHLVDIPFNPSCHLRACMYLFGINVEVDEKKSINILEENPDCSDCITVYGLCYEYGKGVGKSYTTAFDMYRRGMKLNNSVSMTFLAECYIDGYGVPIDISKGIELMERAMELNNPIAIHNLAFFYTRGKCFPQNIHKSIELYQRAINLGSSSALTNLASCYSIGIGVPKDINKGVELSHQAVKMGSKMALYNLGSMYMTLKEYDKSIVFFKKYIALTEGKEKIDSLESLYKLAEYYESHKEYKDLEKAVDLYIYIREHGLQKAVTKINQNYHILGMYKAYMMEKRMERMRDNINNMIESIMYAPGMVGAIQAQQDFETLAVKRKE